jgi:hypothetical protein
VPTLLNYLTAPNVVRSIQDSPGQIVAHTDEVIAGLDSGRGI